jgi:ornithine cyclodeaminase
MRIVSLAEIKASLEGAVLLEDFEAGFMAFSAGKVVVPPVGELLFRDPPGDVHIKYGYIEGDEDYLIKVASGFYGNAALGLNPNPGFMLLASQTTGELRVLLLEEGYLTNIRTALAGAIAARHLARKDIGRIGVCGTGLQARMQIEALRHVTPCRQIVVWGRRLSEAQRLAGELTAEGFFAAAVATPAEAADVDLLVTTTAAETPYITADMLRPGTHVTAMGSDTELKNELHPGVLARAGLVVADSVAQCVTRGEIHHALRAGSITSASVVELGKILAGDHQGRIDGSMITVCDLTGVAVQDIVIAKAVVKRLASGSY